MTKLRYVPWLNSLARKMVTNLEHTARKLAGTQEARRSMRFDIQAHRVKYGVPIFIILHLTVLLKVRALRQQATQGLGYAPANA